MIYLSTTNDVEDDGDDDDDGVGNGDDNVNIAVVGGAVI